MDQERSAKCLITKRDAQTIERGWPIPFGSKAMGWPAQGSMSVQNDPDPGVQCRSL